MAAVERFSARCSRVGGRSAHRSERFKPTEMEWTPPGDTGEIVNRRFGRDDLRTYDVDGKRVILDKYTV